MSTQDAIFKTSGHSLKMHNIIYRLKKKTLTARQLFIFSRDFYV